MDSTPQSSSAPRRLASTVVDWPAMSAIPTPVGERRDLFDVATATLRRLESHVTTLSPGQVAHPPHRHPEEEMVVVRAGRLAITVEDRVYEAGVGAVAFFASGDFHGLRNSGDTPATYVIIRFWSSDTRESLD